jgi:hypothetical protein
MTDTPTRTAELFLITGATGKTGKTGKHIVRFLLTDVSTLRDDM